MSLASKKLFDIKKWEELWKDLYAVYGYNYLEDLSTKEPKIAAEWCTYAGKRVRIISKNFQTGEAVLEDRDVTGPFTLTVKLSDIVMESANTSNKCTCGNDSLAPSSQGNHADYCDKYFKLF